MVYYKSKRPVRNKRPLHERRHNEFLLKDGSPPFTIEFKNIYKSVPGRQEPVLKNISGEAKPNELIAIMGPSGSGKTTLLNALSGRSKIDKGKITVNEKILTKEHKRKMAYALQHDAFLPNLSLKATLTFHAEMGLPSSMTSEQKMEYKNRLVSHLKLDDAVLLETKMGDVTKRGLSGGETKRANIACELLSNPTVLFVDEPTTGLDSYNAFKVVEILKNVSRNNKTVIVTIHQPSYKIFEMFDKVLLLCNGEVAYFGKREDVLPTLRNLNIEIDAHSNLADILVDQCYIEKNRKALIDYVKNGQPENTTAVDLDQDVKTNDNNVSEEMPMENLLSSDTVHENSQEGNQLKESLLVENGSTHHTLINKQGDKNTSRDSGRSSMHSDSSFVDVENPNYKDEKWPTSVFQQVRILAMRNFRDSCKKFVGCLGLFHLIVLSFLIGFFWYGTERIEEDLNQIKSLTFFTNTYWFLNPAFESLTIFSSERIVVNKERAAGIYRLFPYYFAKILAEGPLAKFFPLVFHTITTVAFGFQTFTSFFALAVILLLLVSVSQSVGFFISTTIDNPLNINRGIVACSLVCLPSILFGGFFVTDMVWWIQPFQYLSPVYHAYRAMNTVMFHYGDPIMCAGANSSFGECLSGNATFISPISITGVEDPLQALIIPICVLLIYITVFRVAGYLQLRFRNSPTNTL